MRVKCYTRPPGVGPQNTCSLSIIASAKTNISDDLYEAAAYAEPPWKCLICKPGAGQVPIIAGLLCRRVKKVLVSPTVFVLQHPFANMHLACSHFLRTHAGDELRSTVNKT